MRKQQEHFDHLLTLARPEDIEALKTLDNKLTTIANKGQIAETELKRSQATNRNLENALKETAEEVSELETAVYAIERFTQECVQSIVLRDQVVGEHEEIIERQTEELEQGDAAFKELIDLLLSSIAWFTINSVFSA